MTLSPHTQKLVDKFKTLSGVQKVLQGGVKTGSWEGFQNCFTGPEFAHIALDRKATLMASAAPDETYAAAACIWISEHPAEFGITTPRELDSVISFFALKVISIHGKN